jgi:ABC-type transporter lipoprotein component MlaA
MWNIYGNSDRRRSLNLELGLGGLARICEKAENITSLDDETKFGKLIVQYGVVKL